MMYKSFDYELDKFKKKFYFNPIGNCTYQKKYYDIVDEKASPGP